MEAIIKEKIMETTIGKKELEVLDILSQGIKPSAKHEENGAN
jgi:hypothetical protein